jgi:hypothetical protein
MKPLLGNGQLKANNIALDRDQPSRKHYVKKDRPRTRTPLSGGSTTSLSAISAGAISLPMM